MKVDKPVQRNSVSVLATASDVGTDLSLWDLAVLFPDRRSGRLERQDERTRRDALTKERGTESREAGGEDRPQLNRTEADGRVRVL